MKFWTLDTFFYIPLALLVKFPAVSLYFLFYFSSRLRLPHRPSVMTHFFSLSIAPASHTASLPLSFLLDNSF
jgi:hypothetical protein